MSAADACEAVSRTPRRALGLVLHRVVVEVRSCGDMAGDRCVGGRARLQLVRGALICTMPVHGGPAEHQRRRRSRSLTPKPGSLRLRRMSNHTRRLRSSNSEKGSLREPELASLVDGKVDVLRVLEEGIRVASARRTFVIWVGTSNPFQWMCPCPDAGGGRSRSVGGPVCP